MNLDILLLFSITHGKRVPINSALQPKLIVKDQKLIILFQQTLLNLHL